MIQTAQEKQARKKCVADPCRMARSRREAGRLARFKRYVLPPAFGVGDAIDAEKRIKRASRFLGSDTVGPGQVSQNQIPAPASCLGNLCLRH